ncbi:MAG: dihydroorotase [Saprospiraceae bacterium]|nr:dihydroorotase [Saprospiraceae bacterium]
MNKLIIKNALIINEGSQFYADLLIKGQRIERIDPSISVRNEEVFDAGGLCLIPGCIDDQVHFREPGLTHKATIFSESRAAVAGGITSFMEMPNTIPQALTQQLLEDKYNIASKTSAANYSFYMGASNHNLEDVLAINYDQVCGIKVFMGSSTGDMLVDNVNTLENLFKNAPVLIATHCEDEATVKANLLDFQNRWGASLHAEMHPQIRNREACYKSSSLAVALAKKHGTRLHILHISTKEELSLFDATLALSEKRITAEGCVHHMFFNDSHYASLGNKIKCNPAIKTLDDSEAIAYGLKSGAIDVVATDHAPHTLEEKEKHYLEAPAGLPLVQHSLLIMLSLAEKYSWDLPFIVRKMSHDPAVCFQVQERGYIREGYFADLVLVDPNSATLVDKSSLFYKCAWSPLEGFNLKGKIKRTWVNGNLVFDGSSILSAAPAGLRLQFKRS